MTTRIFFTSSYSNGNELSVFDGAGIHTIDIFPGSGFSSFPSQLFNYNGTVLFQAFASNPSRGQELWKSNGTAAGTVLVKDINPGGGDSAPAFFANLNGTAFFRASTSGNGQELWRTDGTDPGTVPLPDINPAGGSSGGFNPLSTLLPVGDSLFFWATNGATNGRELWRYDGSTAFMLKDIRPGSPSSQDGSSQILIAALGNSVVFAANNGVVGEELWISDGTPDGTQLLANIAPDSPAPNPVIRSSSIAWLTTVGNSVFFSADNSSLGNPVGGAGHELWKTDGATTALVKDIRPGSVNDSSQPRYLTAVGDTLYFFADDGTNGVELWKSNGSEGGTTIVKNINATANASGNGSPVVGFQLLESPFVGKDGILYFWANDGVNGTEPWRSDGTPDGTFMLKDIRSGSAGSNVDDTAMMRMIVSNGVVYFAANDGAGNTGIWKTDGTPTGTVNLFNVSVNAFMTQFLPVETGVASDFNGDGKADILFANTNSDYLWTMDNRAISSQGGIDLFDPNFSVQVTGDFDGDGKSDVLFENPNTGGVYEWQLNGRTIVSQGAVDVGDKTFHLLGTADFDGSGTSDLLWRNDAGFIYMWKMNGRIDTPVAVSPLDPTWHVVGAGDFNGDNKADLLLRNISGTADNGAFFLWMMDGNNIIGQGGIERPSPVWQTLGVGDFDGDGRSDFAVRNVSATGDNGAVWVYLMNGATIKAQGAAGIADAAVFTVQQIGDLNGDGKDDILFRNDAGYFYSWNMDGTTIASEGLAGTEAGNWADPSLKVVGQHWDLV